MGQFFKALDEPFADSLCENYTGNRDTCAHAERCAVRPVWSELQRRIYGFLDGVTLDDIARGTVEQTAVVVPLAAVRRR